MHSSMVVWGYNRHGTWCIICLIYSNFKVCRVCACVCFLGTCPAFSLRKAILLSAYLTDLVKMKNLEAKLKQCSLLVCSLCARFDLYPLVLSFPGSVSLQAFVKEETFSFSKGGRKKKGCSSRLC